MRHRDSTIGPVPSGRRRRTSIAYGGSLESTNVYQLAWEWPAGVPHETCAMSEMPQRLSSRALDPDADVTAAEAASYAYCAKAWHLERVLGLRASDTALQVRTAGVVRHERHGRRVALFLRRRVLAWWAAACLVLAATLLLLALLTATRTTGS